MQLNINLASRTYLNRRKFNRIIAVLFVVLGILLLINIKNAATNAGDISSTAKQVALYEGKLTGDRVIPEKEYETVLAKIKFANQIIDKKTFNWMGLLDKLEGVVPDGVALSAIEPNPATEELKLAGAAKNFNKLRQFMENLENSKDFREVYLISQAQVKIGQTQQGTNFNISCKVGLK